MGRRSRRARPAAGRYAQDKYPTLYPYLECLEDELRGAAARRDKPTLRANSILVDGISVPPWHTSDAHAKRNESCVWCEDANGGHFLADHVALILDGIDGPWFMRTTTHVVEFLDRDNQRQQASVTVPEPRPGLLVALEARRGLPKEIEFAKSVQVRVAEHNRVIGHAKKILRHLPDPAVRARLVAVLDAAKRPAAWDSRKAPQGLWPPLSANPHKEITRERFWTPCVIQLVAYFQRVTPRAREARVFERVAEILARASGNQFPAGARGAGLVKRRWYDDGL